MNLAPRTNKEFQQMGQIKDQMKGELHVRKSELAKANTLIDWDAEARWQNFEKSAKRCRYGSLAKSSLFQCKSTRCSEAPVDHQFIH